MQIAQFSNGCHIVLNIITNNIQSRFLGMDVTKCRKYLMTIEASHCAFSKLVYPCELSYPSFFSVLCGLAMKASMITEKPSSPMGFFDRLHRGNTEVEEYTL